MKLFGTAKKYESEVSSTESDRLTDNKGVYSVKVLGTGCATCHTQYENAKHAVKAMGLPVDVEYITDLQKVTDYGVMSMPAIVVNDKVVSMGRLLKSKDIEELLQKLTV